MCRSVTTSRSWPGSPPGSPARPTRMRVHRIGDAAGGVAPAYAEALDEDDAIGYPR